MMTGKYRFEWVNTKTGSKGRGLPMSQANAEMHATEANKAYPDIVCIVIKIEDKKDGDGG